MTDDTFEVLHRWPAEEPAGVVRERAIIRVPIPRGPTLMIGTGSVRCGKKDTPFDGALAVRVVYMADRFSSTISAQLNLESRLQSVAILPGPLIVIRNGQTLVSPQTVRWMAEQIAQRAEAHLGNEVPVWPAPTGEPPPELPAAAVLELVEPALPRGVTRTDTGFRWTAESYNLVWLIPAVALPVLSVTLLPYVAGMIGAIGEVLGFRPEPVAILAWLILAAMALAMVFPMLWMALRQRVAFADADGIRFVGKRGGHQTWEQLGDLSLEGRLHGPVRLISDSGERLAEWRRPQWNRNPRILDVAKFGRVLADQAGVRYRRAIPSFDEWRRRAQTKRNAAAQKGFWTDLAQELTFADLQAATPIEPARVAMDPDGWKLPVSNASWIRFGSSFSFSRTGTVFLRADPNGLGTGKKRTPWSAIESIEVEFNARTTGGDSETKRVEGRLVATVAGKKHQLGPWVPHEIDDQKVIPPGELIWTRDTLRRIHAQYADHTPESTGSAADIPDELRQIAQKRKAERERERQS